MSLNFKEPFTTSFNRDAAVRRVLRDIEMRLRRQGRKIYKILPGGGLIIGPIKKGKPAPFELPGRIPPRPFQRTITF